MPTRRTDYAIRAMVFLAGRPDQLVKADGIAEGMDIPRTFIPKCSKPCRQRAW